MIRLLWVLSICCLSISLKAQMATFEKTYIESWKEFYPSIAVRQGMHEAVFRFEKRSATHIEDWKMFNQNILDKCLPYLSSSKNSERINATHLSMQARSELQRWSKEQPHVHDFSFYVNMLVRGLPEEKEVSYLSRSEWSALQHNRLDGITELCKAARENLQSDKASRAPGALQQLEDLKSEFRDRTHDLSDQSVISAISALDDLIALGKTIKERPSTSSLLGAQLFGERLKLYTDSEVSAEELADLAYKEIKTVRFLMEKTAGEHWRQAYPDKTIPTDGMEVLQQALRDMESDATSSAEEYTSFWNELADSLIQFLAHQDIATVPENQTLSIVPAPESAGPAARIGWVASSPPFAPNPWTTLYLPSVPDTLSEEEQRDFWSSFNRPFNRFIAIHELFPGHYMQIKISRETPHHVRLLFPYGPYFEGWATFCEKVVLDAGWDHDRPLTMLAHLRKRLENANRAYMSVMVHTQGWSKEEVMRFSTEEALLAPQFAKSLWGRLMRSPMQITSYFYGGVLFKEMYLQERQRAGDRFDLRIFMDTIMQIGPIPISEFSSIFKEIWP
ncbi:MAG: DUF885 domain-containing protein [Saprospiraceae bacterium]|nr:DUF885 domain-containing protein [Saprospiraceae bacterium]